MTNPKKWPPAVVSNIRGQLNSNTRRDLLQWARRVIANPPNSAELEMARLVMSVEKNEVK